MRILLCTQDEPFQLPVFFQTILERCLEDVVGIVILSPFKHGSSFFTVARRQLDLLGPVDFFLFGCQYALYKLLDRTGRSWRGRFYSVVSVASHFNVPTYRPSNINSREFLDFLAKDVRPDLIVSVAASAVFKRRLLDLPPLGCINVHSAPLPRYRGMLPSFWVLYNGEKQTAVTIHYMDEKLDDGDIILQQSVPIAPEETFHSLVAKTKHIGAELLLQAFDLIETGSVVTLPNDHRQATYYSFPTREDARRFRASGRRFRQ